MQTELRVTDIFKCPECGYNRLEERRTHLVETIAIITIDSEGSPVRTGSYHTVGIGKSAGYQCVKCKTPVDLADLASKAQA